MTRDEIMALSGRELDAAVAEYVMGWSKHRRKNPLYRYGDPGLDFIWVPPQFNGNVAYRRSLPWYSSDISAAWQVVEELEWPINLHNCVHGEWECAILCPYEDENGEPRVAAVEPTAPAAICRAALLLKVAEAEGQRPRDETTCPKCQGKGYVHGFGEHGADPDWCPSCDGHGVIALDVRPSKNGVE